MKKNKLIIILSVILALFFIGKYFYHDNTYSFTMIKNKLPKTEKIVLSTNTDIYKAISRDITNKNDIKEITRILSNIEQSNNEIVAGVGSSYRLTLYDKNNKKIVEIECIPGLSILNKSYNISLNRKDYEMLNEIIKRYNLKYYYDTFKKIKTELN